MIVNGKTKSGFEFHVDADCLQDAEFLELFADVQSDGAGKLKIFDLIKKALGPEQKKKLYDHVRDAKTGRVPVDALAEEAGEIFSTLGDNPATKN